MAVFLNDAAILAAARRGAMRGIVRATESVRNEAVKLILDTPKTGRVYRRRGVEHTASAPGEPPASDIGRLVGSINTDFNRLDELVGVVRASTGYAAHLEYGTKKMEPRPFMRPALANKKREIEATINAEVHAELVGLAAGSKR